MSKSDEQSVSKRLSDGLSLVFKNTKYSLDGWGEVDNWAILNDETFLLIEVETAQKHPCTNVTKLWPYMEQHVAKRFFLIQVFFPDSPGLKSSRGRLGEWVAEKLKKMFPNRFGYCKLIVENDMDFSDLDFEIKRFENQH